MTNSQLKLITKLTVGVFIIPTLTPISVVMITWGPGDLKEGVRHARFPSDTWSRIPAGKGFSAKSDKLFPFDFARTKLEKRFR